MHRTTDAWSKAPTIVEVMLLLLESHLAINIVLAVISVQWKRARETTLHNHMRMIRQGRNRHMRNHILQAAT